MSKMFAGQDWYVSPRRYQSSTYATKLWPWLYKCPKGTVDILVKLGIEVNWNKFPNIDDHYE